MHHSCGPDCDPPVHADVLWTRPLGTILTLPDGDPYADSSVRAVLSVILHTHGWRVRRFVRQRPDGRPPTVVHRECWQVFIEPCPDCGPPTATRRRATWAARSPGRVVGGCG